MRREARTPPYEPTRPPRTALAVARRDRCAARLARRRRGSSTSRSRTASRARTRSPSRTSSGSGSAAGRGPSRRQGLDPRVRHVSNSDVEEGFVFAQDPTEGTRVDEGEVVRIDVSSGRPEVHRPDRGRPDDRDAVAELTRSGLNAQVVEVNSDRDEGTVTAQSPSAGLVVVEGTQVRINVSKGPRPVSVPNVVGLPYDQAAAELQSAGFDVSRIEADSDQAPGIVTDQDPSGGSESSRGSTVTCPSREGRRRPPSRTSRPRTSPSRRRRSRTPASGRASSSRTPPTRPRTAS